MKMTDACERCGHNIVGRRSVIRYITVNGNRMRLKLCHVCFEISENQLTNDYINGGISYT